MIPSQPELIAANGNGYKGNPRLRLPYIVNTYTAEQAIEIVKCMEDPIYFCTNYCKIITLDHGLQPFVPRPYQVKAINTIKDERFVILKMSRQSGKTATVAATLIWHVLFNDMYNVACLAHKQDQAIEILDRIKVYFENLPLWMQQGVMTWNKKRIELENGSKIFAAATSSGSVRGQTINCIAGEGLVTVKDKLTGEIKQISIEELYADSSK